MVVRRGVIKVGLLRRGVGLLRRGVLDISQLTRVGEPVLINTPLLVSGVFGAAGDLEPF